MKLHLRLLCLTFCMLWYTQSYACKVYAPKNTSIDSSTAILKKYASYNRWANEQLLKWLDNATETQLRQEVPSSFNSLFKTILHLWGAEMGWLRTLKNEPWVSPAGADTLSYPELKRAFTTASIAFEQHVLKLNSNDINAQKTLSGGKSTKAADIILHVFNHATYHRGQLINIGRQVGLQHPPRTDYIYFLGL